MSPDDPRHGTYAGYWQHRKHDIPLCFPCRLAASAYEVNRARQTAYGRWNPWVDAEPVREHVNYLRAEGMTIRGIAAAAEVHVERISHLIYGKGPRKPPTRVRPDYAAKVLAITPNPARVPGHRITRRLQALLALGHSSLTLSQRLGVSKSRVSQMMTDDTVPYMRDTLDRVSALYDELSMVIPDPQTRAEKQGASYARGHARRMGWVPPLAWDNIDDPAEKPTGVYDPTRTHDRTAERADIITDILNRGGNHYEAARTLGIRLDALEKWCERHDMRPIYNRLRERAHLEDKFRNTGKAA